MWAAEQLAWNKVDSHWPVRVDWTGGAFVRAQNLRSCQMNKCHFTIIMSCVQSTLRNIRYSDKFGLRINFGFGHALFFIAWIKFEFFINLRLRQVFNITFVIIRCTEIFLKVQSIVIPMQEWSLPAAYRVDELQTVKNIDLSGRTVSME